MGDPTVFVVAISTEADQRAVVAADRSGFSKPKQATFEADAPLRFSLANPTVACIAEFQGPDLQSRKIYDCTNRDGLEAFLTHLLSGSTGFDSYRDRGLRIIGNDISDKMRIVVGAGIRAGLAHCIKPWMWYSHFYNAGELCDPYLDFLDTDARQLMSRENFYHYIGAAPTDAAVTCAQEYEVLVLTAAADKLGLLQ